MPQSQEAQPAASSSQPTQRWTLMETAPGWFRRVWTERSREVPKLSEADLNRIRRIAYL
jgi:hypothetical protein